MILDHILIFYSVPDDLNVFCEQYPKLRIEVLLYELLQLEFSFQKCSNGDKFFIQVMYNWGSFHNFRPEHLQLLDNTRKFFLKTIYNEISGKLPLPAFPQKIAMNNGLDHGLLVGDGFQFYQCPHNAIILPD